MNRGAARRVQRAILALESPAMTPLQEFVHSIVALLPGLIPHLLLVWAGAAIAATVKLGIDEFSGDSSRGSLLSAAGLGLRIGVMLTFVIVFGEACSKGLISGGVASVLGGGGVAFGFTFAKNRKPELDVELKN